MIEVDQVTKYYGAHPAVRNLDFRIGEGECIGFLGLNGAGKTTILKLLSCLLLPTSGRVVIRGIDAEERPHDIRKFIGFLPDDPPLYPEMTVTEYVRFAGQIRRMSRDDVEKRIPDVFETCGLKEVADQPIATLSHGYKQRVGIAQATIHDPDLLILDEPIQGLDPVQIVEMREMIRRLRGKHTILLSTHILSEIEQTCDRILILHDGRIVADERFDEELPIEVEVRIPHDAAGGYRSAPGTGESPVHEALSSIEEIEDIQLTWRDEESLLVRVRARNDVRERISRALVESGHGLRSLRRISTGLEHLFIALSRGGKADKQDMLGGNGSNGNGAPVAATGTAAKEEVEHKEGTS